MTTTRATATARIIAAARREGRVLDALPDDCRPRTIAEGYAAQAAFRSLWPDRLAGWKIGATSEAIMTRFGVSEPLIGPFFAADVMASPARARASSFQHTSIETEFAFRLGADLPVRPGGYKREEIVAAIDALVPAFELLNPRFVRPPFDNAPAAVADCVLNGAMVLGVAVTDWRRHDLPSHPVTLSVDGAKKAAGRGGDVLGDPLAVLEWAVGALGRLGIDLHQGEVLSTGTCTGVVQLAAGEIAVGDFGPLGRIELVYA